MTTTATMTATENPHITIRPAGRDDFDAATSLFQSTMGASFSLSRELWETLCAADNHRAIVAIDEHEKVVGLSIIVVSDRIRLAAGTHRRRFHIDELIVAPEERRHGIGRALLEHIKEMASQDAPSYVIINCVFTNVAARRLYESAGMHLVRQADDRFEIAFT